jgi:hypothetical protein
LHLLIQYFLGILDHHLFLYFLGNLVLQWNLGILGILDLHLFLYFLGNLVHQ